MTQLSLFAFKWRIFRDFLKFPIQFGSSPSKLFSDKLRILRDLKLQMNGEIFPLKLLERRDRKSKVDKVGIGPET